VGNRTIIDSEDNQLSTRQPLARGAHGAIRARRAHRATYRILVLRGQTLK
jgi:hypothetical protein